MLSLYFNTHITVNRLYILYIRDSSDINKE